MFGTIAVASIILLSSQVQDVKRETIKRNRVYEAIAEMRFQPEEYAEIPEEYWPLHHRGSTFNISFSYQLSGSSDVVMAFATAQYRIANGDFDLEILNAISPGYGIEAKIDVIGDLRIRANLPLLSSDPEKCREVVRRFSSQASRIAREARAYSTAVVESVPPDPDKGRWLQREPDESKIVTFLSTHDVTLLISAWNLHLTRGFAGTGVGFWYPFQFEGFELTLRQYVTEEIGIRSSVIRAFSIRHSFPAPAMDAAGLLTGLREKYTDWQFELIETPLGERNIGMLRVLDLGPGVSLGEIREYLESSAKGANAAATSH